MNPAELRDKFPLPDGWSEPEVFADQVEVDGVVVRRTGVACRNGAGFEVTGSAANRDSDPLPRAWYELLERAATVEAGVEAASVEHPDQRPSRSNGIALHTTWADATRAARLELIERDQLLRAWHGEFSLRPVEPPPQLGAYASYSWAAGATTSPEGVFVAIVIGFPADASLPLARGLAAREREIDAIAAAGAEAQQSLAFLWGEPVPDALPRLTPTAMFHLDYYLYPGRHGVLRRWISGEPMTTTFNPSTRAPLNVEFEDLRGTDWAAPLVVVRATDPLARRLIFGVPPDDWPELEPHQIVHPVA